MCKVKEITINEVNLTAFSSSMDNAKLNESLKNISYVNEFRLSGGGFEVKISGSWEEDNKLLDDLMKKGILIKFFSLEDHSLEAVCMKLTQGKVQ